MNRITVVGKDWGFFASSLAEDLANRGFEVRRRFAPNELLTATSGPAGSQSFNFLRRKFRETTKPLWVYQLARKVANFVSVLWWVTGLGGSKIIVVSGIPSIFQTKTFMSLCRTLGKQVVLCVHGTDGRPPFLNGLYTQEARDIGGRRFAQYVEYFQKKVSIAATKSTAVISWMGTSHFIPRDVFLFEEVGFPMRDPAAATSLSFSPRHQYRDAPNGPFRVLHAPSSVGKGSSEIRQAIEGLRAKGYPFELNECVDRPNREVLEDILNSDLVVDQVYSDNFAGALAREAAMLSRFVIVGGNSFPLMKPKNFELPPVMISSVQKLKTDLISCFENRDNLPQKAEKLRLHFQSKNFAEFFTTTFLAPNFDERAPSNLSSRTPFVDFHPGFGGYGPNTEIRAMLQSIIENACINGLHLPTIFAEKLLAHYDISLTRKSDSS